MKVLVVGGTRFLGAAIVRELARRGHGVSVLHRGRTRAPLPESVEHVLGDARDPAFVNGVLIGGEFDAVVDTILQAADLEWYLPLLRRHAGQLIHCGSTGVYAPAASLPSREDDPTPCPPELGNFGEKLRQDRLIVDFCEETGFKTVSLRPSNIFGAGDIPLDPWGGRDLRFFQKVADGEVIIIPNDGRALLQPVHVDDLARAFADALESEEAAGQVYNLSSDRAVTLTHYAALVRDLLESSSPMAYADIDEILAMGRANESGLRFVCEHMCVDIGKARRDLGYVPRYDARAGLLDSLEWMARQGLLHKR